MNEDKMILLISNATLHHIEKKRAWFDEIRRAIKRNRKLITAFLEICERVKAVSVENEIKKQFVNHEHPYN